MPFRVNSPRAQNDLIGTYEFIDAIESTAADKWFNGLQNAVESLANLPERGALTSYDPALRFLLYGNRPHIYRILYRIDARCIG